MSNDLTEVCDKLQRDAGSRKVMVCGADGEVLAHAGLTGALDEAAGEAIAALVADVVQQAAQVGQIRGADDIVVTVKNTLQACAASIGNLAALVVLFDGATSLDRVRTKMRRARTLLEKALQSATTGAEGKGNREPS